MAKRKPAMVWADRAFRESIRGVEDTDPHAVLPDEPPLTPFTYARAPITATESDFVRQLPWLALGTKLDRRMSIGDHDPEQCGWLRCIFGNPFRPVAFHKSWRTSTAVALAATMYESRDFAALPILADALEEAGCDAAELLAHCRDPHRTHVRGCWAVDLVLGKG